MKVEYVQNLPVEQQNFEELDKLSQKLQELTVAVTKIQVANDNFDGLHQLRFYYLTRVAFASFNKNLLDPLILEDPTTRENFLMKFRGFLIHLDEALEHERQGDPRIIFELFPSSTHS